MARETGGMAGEVKQGQVCQRRSDRSFPQLSIALHALHQGEVTRSPWEHAYVWMYVIAGAGYSFGPSHG